jgi:type II secretory pathway component PulM
MSPSRRKSVLAGLLLVLLAGAAFWSLDWMSQCRQGAAQAAADLLQSRALAAGIAALASRPTVAASQPISANDLGRKIQASAGQAGLGESAIREISPQPQRRVGDSAYVQKPTAMNIRGVTLTQLATFLYHLTLEPGLTVSELRLRAPRGEAAADAWDAEVTVSCVVYSPVAKAKGSP